MRLATVTEFIQYQPYEGRTSSQPTAAYLGYDRKNLYVAFICRDSYPRGIHAQVTPRDANQGDDWVGVVIDTYNDHRRAYQFAVNPLGIQYDALVNEKGYGDANFDTLWYSQGRLTPWGYVALMTIPFTSLRFPPGAHQTWGIILTRSIPGNSELSTWPTISLNINGFLVQEAEIRGLEDISTGKNVVLIPYGFFSSSRILDRVVNQFKRNPLDQRIGLDLKWVFGSNMTFDATLNPDFSQVESDEPQITVNQRFEVFFPEKRPFFMENSDFFQTPITVLFTRRIADPQFGLRLTGKVGRTKIGALVADDRSPGEVVPPGDPSFGRRAVFNVFRLSHDIRTESSIGVVWSDREFQGSFNRVIGPDGRWKISRTTALDLQFLKSFSRDLSGNTKGGTAAHLALAHSARHWDYNWNYEDRSPDFEVASGFIPRVDFRSTRGHFGYTFRPENRWVASWQPYVEGTLLLDHRNVRQDYEVRPGFWMFLPIGTDMGSNFVYHRERFQGIDFLWREFRTNFGNGRNRWIGFGVTYQQGQSINISPASGLPPFLGRGNELELSFTVRPSKQLAVTNSYLQSRLLTIDKGLNIFNNNIFRSRWNYQFTPRLALRLIGEYSNVLPSQRLSSLAYSKRLSGDILLTYLVHPGTALYVGYNNMLENFDRLALAQTGVLARSNRNLLSTGAGLFVKVSYRYQF